jgi:spore germination protein YaaH
MRAHANVVPLIAALAVIGGAAATTGTRARPRGAAGRHAALTLWGFTGPWDPRSDSSLGANARRLDGVVSGWLQLDSVTGLPRRAYADRAPALAPGVARLALVTSYQGTRFHSDMVRRVAADPAALASVAGAIAAAVATDGYHGLVLDLEGAALADVPLMTHFVRAVGDSARGRGVSPVVMIVPAADTAAYPAHAFIPGADFVMVMCYDQHWATSAPGSVSSPAWTRNTLARRVAAVGASKVIAALPVYGYEWRTGRPTVALSFAAARTVATQAGASLDRDPVTQSLRAAQPGQWELWLSDGPQLTALLAPVTDLGVRRVALFRLGLEDPAVWGALGRP